MGAHVRVLAVVLGPLLSGVARHGLAVAEALAEVGVDVTVVRRTDEPVDGPYDVVFVQYTDALFGADAASAAAAFVDWSESVPGPLVVTLHDVPGADPDRARDARRLTAYARVVSACAGVVFCSERERTGLGVRGVVHGVIPLPLMPLPAPGPEPAWGGRPTLAVLGFVYPGKGHAKALEAAAALRGTAGSPAEIAEVVAVGGPSPGCSGLLRDLHRRAAELGVPFRVTGPLSDADLHAAALAATVPLGAYRTLGASGSLMTWLACGRRPVVTRGPQSQETEARWPGSVRQVAPDALVDALAAAFADPASTWLPAPLAPAPLGERHMALFASVLAEARGPGVGAVLR